MPNNQKRLENTDCYLFWKKWFLSKYESYDTSWKINFDKPNLRKTNILLNNIPIISACLVLLGISTINLVLS